jgi:hypothetical protein
MVAAAFGDMQIAGALEGRSDSGADGGQVGGPAACATPRAEHGSGSASSFCHVPRDRFLATAGTGLDHA